MFMHCINTERSWILYKMHTEKVYEFIGTVVNQKK